jgi:hypothetical protein
MMTAVTLDAGPKMDNASGDDDEDDEDVAVVDLISITI